MDPIPADSVPQTSIQETAASPGVAEPQWSAMLAMWTAPWIPARTARATRKVPLLSAFAVHLLAGFASFIVISFLLAMASPSRIFDPFQLLGEILEEFQRDPEEATLITATIVVLIEIGLLVLALLATPWGARDEKLGQSFRHALRAVWIHCGHAPVAILLVGTVVLIAENSQRFGPGLQFSSPMPTAPTMPSPPPPNSGPNSQAARDYAAAMKDYMAAQARYQQEMAAWNAEYQRAWQEHRRNRPFMARYGYVIAMNLGIVTGVWVLAALLRGLASRPVAVVERPPICEACGYNLTGTAREGRCPECGRRVEESLLPEVRPGTAWERRREQGTVRAYLRTLADTLVLPSAPGEKMQVFAFRNDAWRILALHLSLAFVIGAAGVSTMFWIEIGGNAQGFIEYQEVFGVVAPLASAMATSAGFGWLCACAVGVAATCQPRVERNLANAAARVGAHHSAFLVFWMTLAALEGMLFFELEREKILTPISKALRIDEFVLVFASIIGLHIAMAGWFLLLIWKGTTAARFANR